MTQIEQKTANAVAKLDPDGGNLPFVQPSPNTKPAKHWQPSDLQGLRGVDPQVIMQRVAEGELLRDIAKDYGVSRAAVSVHIMRHADKEQWAEVRRLSAAARLEMTESEFGQAHDVVTLARARDTAQHRRWRAEREHPEVYGQRPSTAIQVAGDGMQVQIVSYASTEPAQIEHAPDDE